MTSTVCPQLVAVVVTVLLLMGAADVFGWRYTLALSRKIESLYEHNLRAAVQLADAEDALWRLRYGFSQFLVLEAEERLAIIDEEPRLYALIHDKISTYEAGVRTPEEHAVIQEWTYSQTKYLEAPPRWFDLIRAGKLDQAAAWRAATTTPSGAAAVTALRKLIELQRQVAEDKKQESLHLGTN